MSDPGIPEAARAIRAFLGGLVSPNDADTLDRTLGLLLAEARAGGDVEGRLRDLLLRHPATHAWVADFLVYGYPPELVPMRERGYSRLLGDPVASLPRERWSCPQRDYDWWPRAIGEEPPACPYDGEQLVRVTAS